MTTSEIRPRTQVLPMIRVVAVVAVALLGGSLFAVAEPPAKVAALIEDLGSDVYLEREAAEKSLETLGEPAVELLRKATKSPNPEISRRANGLLARIERRL